MNYYNGGCRGVVSNSINLSIFIDLLAFFYNEELSLPSFVIILQKQFVHPTPNLVPMSRLMMSKMHQWGMFVAHIMRLSGESRTVSQVGLKMA